MCNEISLAVSSYKTDGYGNEVVAATPGGRCRTVTLRENLAAKGCNRRLLLFKRLRQKRVEEAVVRVQLATDLAEELKAAGVHLARVFGAQGPRIVE